MTLEARILKMLRSGPCYSGFLAIAFHEATEAELERALAWLEEAGYVDRDGGPYHRTYSITLDGRRELDELDDAGRRLRR